MSSARNTFVISMRDQGGPATIQEIRTGRKARLSSLGDTPAQIERWLREPGPGSPDPSATRAGEGR